MTCEGLVPLTCSGRLIGVGVGPGDPELVTAKALRVLDESDRVFAPSVAVDAVGRAESVVRQLRPDLGVCRVVFTMGGDAPEEAPARALLPGLDAGEQVAFVTLGDPNIYSTFSALAAAVRRLRPGVEVRTVPGIMAFQALAASAGVVLAEGAGRLALVTGLSGTADLETAVSDRGSSVVVYKGGRHLPAMAAVLARARRLDRAVFGELLGLPGEHVGTVAAVADRPAAYLATVIVPPGGDP